MSQALFHLFQEDEADKSGAVSSPFAGSSSWEQGGASRPPRSEEEEEEDRLCGVCADESVAFYAVNCRHAACETCWRAWLATPARAALVENRVV